VKLISFLMVCKWVEHVIRSGKLGLDNLPPNDLGLQLVVINSVELVFALPNVILPSDRDGI